MRWMTEICSSRGASKGMIAREKPRQVLHQFGELASGELPILKIRRSYDA
uniref:Uncharacterized protein n=1 Tax=Rhizophora mucronata TaxID=61149 RepID=A0A2P2P985_RHIMU